MISIARIMPRSIKNKIKNSLFYAHVRVNLLKKPIRVWFFREPNFTNFGDELTVDIIERLFRKKCELTNIEDADLYAVGSIIEIVDQKRGKRSYVWGSGFIHKCGSVASDNLVFKATRGYFSRKALPEKYQQIAVGDPGLLSNLVYKDVSVPTDCIGIIPHYVDSDDEILAQARNDKRYKIISVRDTPDSVIKQLTGCKVVLSSSLHGLIVADSFGIPNMHMLMSSKLTGGDYKFKDYYSSIGRGYRQFRKENLYNDRKLEEVINTYKPISNIKDIQHALIDSFPF